MLHRTKTSRKLEHEIKEQKTKENAIDFNCDYGVYVIDIYILFYVLNSVQVTFTIHNDVWSTSIWCFLFMYNETDFKIINYEFIYFILFYLL